MTWQKLRKQVSFVISRGRSCVRIAVVLLLICALSVLRYVPGSLSRRLVHIIERFLLRRIVVINVGARMIRPFGSTPANKDSRISKRAKNQASSRTTPSSPSEPSMR